MIIRYLRLVLCCFLVYINPGTTCTSVFGNHNNYADLSMSIEARSGGYNWRNTIMYLINVIFDLPNQEYKQFCLLVSPERQ